MTDDAKNYKPKYVSTKVAKELLQVHTDTLRRWANSGRIAAIRYGDKGHRLYDINSILGPEVSDNLSSSLDDSDQKRTICYCRVSSKHQKDDLQRQIASMRQQYPTAVIIDDIGSGINWKRKGLQSVIKQVIDESVGTVVIHHKDRLRRFAYELIEFFFQQFGTKIVVLEQDQYEPNIDQELSDDILSIIQVFSCKKNGTSSLQNLKGLTKSKKKPPEEPVFKRVRKYRLKLSRSTKATARCYMGTCRWTVNQGIEIFNRTGISDANYFRDEIVTEIPRKIITKTSDELTTKNRPDERIITYWMYEERPSWVFKTPKAYRYNILRKLQGNIKSAFANLANKNIKYFKFRFRSKRRNDVTELKADEENCSIECQNGKTYLTMVGLDKMEIVIPKRDRKKGLIPTLAGGVTIRYENNSWYADIYYKVKPTDIKDDKRICALDPGQRSFLSGFDLQGNTFQLGIGVQDQLKNLKQKRNLAQSEYVKAKSRMKLHRSYKGYRMLVRTKRAFYLCTNKIKNYVKQLHYHCCKYLTDNYDKIIIPIYETKKMLQRGKKKFNDMMLSLNHYQFRQLLIAKCQLLRKRVLLCTEEYTSVTCGKCNQYKMNLESDKTYLCSGCGYQADRDENAAYNILRFVIKAALPVKSIE